MNRNLFVHTRGVVEWQDLLWTAPVDRRPAYKLRATFNANGKTTVGILNNNIARVLPGNWEVAA